MADCLSSNITLYLSPIFAFKLPNHLRNLAHISITRHILVSTFYPKVPVIISTQQLVYERNPLHCASKYKYI